MVWVASACRREPTASESSLQGYGAGAKGLGTGTSLSPTIGPVPNDRAALDT